MASNQVQVNGKFLRTGFTTGTAATAALYAAGVCLKTGQFLDCVEVILPSGERLPVQIHSLVLDHDTAIATVLKDGGDDIDVTHGLEIGVRLTLDPLQAGLLLVRGEGVGLVTKKGLSVAVGDLAVNPVPRQMLKQHFEALFGEAQGARAEVFVPEGAEAALKTFNPKLGIEGGISIIGTTGIVTPMSEEAYKHSLALELKQKIETGRSFFVYVFGNYGSAFAVTQGIEEAQIVKTSNFIGYMLDEAAANNIKRILIVGNIGKLIKVSGGIFHTHSHVADGRFEILGAYLAKCRAPYDLIETCMALNTMEEAVEYLDGSGYEGVYQLLADRAKARAVEHVRKKVEIECLLFSEKNKLLASTIKIEAIKEFMHDTGSGYWSGQSGTIDV